jgi:energy-coupling factor transport system substrate-specific component
VNFPATPEQRQGYQKWVSFIFQPYVQKRREAMKESKNTWEFGTRQVVYGAIGAALYGVFSWATNILPLPAAGNVTFRPAVAVLIFFGVAYGPWVGLLAGFIGNTLGDALSGWGFYWNWSLGNGLMGMVPGLVMAAISNFRDRGDILKAVGWGTLGIAVGMLFASLTEMFVGGIDFNTALVGYFLPAFIGNFVVTAVLLPVLMIAFAAVAARRGR